MDRPGGWHGKILRIDLGSGETQRVDISSLAERFTGGRGLLAKLYWDEMKPEAGGLDPENPLILMSGPLAGTPAIGGSRWVIGGKSPFQYPDRFGVGNIGGSFGVRMKSVGLDGMILTGKAKTPSYLFVGEKDVELRDARGLWGLGTSETLERLAALAPGRTESICIGPAGERLARFANIVGGNGSTASSGFGAVMGSKNLKAIVVAEGSAKATVAQPEQLKEVNRRIRALTEGRLIIDPNIEGITLVRNTPCPGCQVGCARGIYRHVSGKEAFLKNCQSAYMYYTWDQNYHDGVLSDSLLLATSLCNDLGLDTQEMGNFFRWLYDMGKHGLLTDDCGIPISKLGSMEFLEAMTRKVVAREGIGDALAEGAIRAAQRLGNGAEALLERHVTPSGFQSNQYNPRCFLSHAVLYATEATSPMRQLHETAYAMVHWVFWMATDGSMSVCDTEVIREIARRFWGGEQAADFSTAEGKGALAKRIQDRGYAKENLVVCDFLYPLTFADGSSDHVGDPTLESRLLEAVTGVACDEEGYYETGARSFNLQRAIHAVEGRAGRDGDRLNPVHFAEPLEEEEGVLGLFNPDFMLPGPGQEIVSRKGAVVKHEEFNRMMDEYYDARGWDPASGLQRSETLERLGLSELIPALAERGLCL